MTCEKNLSITINGPSDFQYWECEEAAGNRVDAVQSAPLVPFTAGAGSVNRVAGKINFGVQLLCPGADQAFIDQTVGTGLTYTTGQGITLAGWFNYTALTDGTISFGFLLGARGLLFLGSTGLGGCFLEDTSPFGITAIPTPSTGAWHFFVLEYVPGTGLRWEIDRNGAISTRAAAEFANGSNIILGFDLDDLIGTAWTFDELGFFPQVLTNAQKDYLFNSGAGRTMPIVLP